MIKIQIDVKILGTTEFDKKVSEANFLFQLKDLLSKTNPNWIAIKLKANKVSTSKKK